MRRRVGLEVAVEPGPGEAPRQAGEEAVQQRTLMLEVIVQRNQPVAELELRGVGALTAVKFARAGAGGPVDGMLVEAKIEKRRGGHAVVEADELVDDPGIHPETHHEGREPGVLDATEEYEVTKVLAGHRPEKLRRHALELDLAFLIGLPVKGEDLLHQRGRGMLDHLAAELRRVSAALELFPDLVAPGRLERF